ncbi:MAG: disulfide bond formation protein B [Hyphomicrobiaceae bacterium]|nr:disulfide bond formation protein B [Hyphomicrobiaceae bacterium]
MTSLVNAHKGDNSNRANAAFTIGLFTILGALAFQYLGGFIPCELCYGQRVPYYVGLPVLALTIALWRVIPVPARIGLTAIVAAIFVWSIYLAVFHAGVEWKFWPGPTSCTGGASDGLNFSDLNNLGDTKVVPCDDPQFRFLGLSFAGYNAIISLIISVLLVWSVMGQITRYRRSGQ